MQNYEYLIHLLNCAMRGEAPMEKPDEVSFEAVFELGKYHEVANFAFLSVEKLENKPEGELYDKWKLLYYFAHQRDARQWEIRRQLLELLHKNGVRTLEAQGTITKKLYPSTDVRMMSDIDFIVDKQNLPKIEELMLENGYTVNHVQDGEVTFYGSNSMEIEFHSDFFTEFMYNRRERYFVALNSAFDYAKPDEIDPLTFVLDDTYFYLYSLLHIIKHFETAGCGIRRILDLYYLEQVRKRSDMAVINRVVDENGFRENVEKVYSVERLWFEGESISVEPELIRDIISAGTHGSAEVHTKNTIIKDKAEGIRFPKLKQLKDFILPSREYIYLSYPVCKERGYSTAKARVYRIFATLKGFKFSHAAARIKQILRSK